MIPDLDIWRCAVHEGLPMKPQEKHIVIAASAIALAMLLFPPWQATVRENVTVNLGYHFVGTAPNIGSIDFVRLLVQLGIVGIIAFAIVKFLSKRP